MTTEASVGANMGADERPGEPGGARYAIAARNLKKSFRRADGVFTVLVDTFALPLGQAVLMQGDSGAGKSTALAMIAALSPLDECGALSLHATRGDIVKLKAGAGHRALRAREFGFVPQAGALLPYLTLRENITQAIRIADLAGGALRPRGIAELADLLQINDALDLKPQEASVGQRQRATLARAIAHGPSILFADEPSAALDFANADRADRLILECVKELSMSAIIVSHRPDRPHWANIARVSHHIEGRTDPVSVFNLS